MNSNKTKLSIRYQLMLMVFLLVSGLIISIASAQENGLKPAAGTASTNNGSLDIKPLDNPYSDPREDAADDPEGLVDEYELIQFSTMANILSKDRRWMTGEVLSTLDTLSLRLDEMFGSAPRSFEKEGVSYEIKLEKVGDLWGKFNPKSDPFVVYLTQELYSGLGDYSVLAYQDGAEISLLEEDFEKLPAIAISVASVALENLPLTRNLSSARIGDEIRFGHVRVDINRPNVDPGGDIAARLGLRALVDNRSTCQFQTNVTSCSGGTPVCSNGGEAHFVLNSALIKTDREGAFKGNPEFEIFPLSELGSVPGGSQAPTTTMIFSGRNVTDAVGRNRFLPDVNNTNFWYNISGGFAVSPMEMSSQWFITAVEQDDGTGVLRTSDTSFRMVLFNNLGNIVSLVKSFSVVKFLRTLFNLIRGLIAGDGDDIFRDAIGVTSSLACANGLNGAQLTLNTQEWNARGVFQCFNVGCVPLVASIAGAGVVNPGGSWSASVSGGQAPYSYVWKKDGSVIGTASSVSTVNFGNFTLSLTVTSSNGQSVTTSRLIRYEDPICGDVFC